MKRVVKYSNKVEIFIANFSKSLIKHRVYLADSPMCYSEREIYANSRRELIHEFVNDSDADLRSYVYCMGFDISFLTYSLCRPLYFGVTGRPLVAYYNL